MPTSANLAIYQGDDYGAVVTVTADSGPLNLTDYTAQGQIRKGPADVNSEVIAEVTAEVVLPNTINLSLSHAVTLTLSGQYVWDLQLIDPGGTITTILAGKVVVTREVTR